MTKNFINDHHMKENELTIEIPKGKFVDWEESKKQNKIVLKDKQVTYEEICKKLLGKDFYFIDSYGDIRHSKSGYAPNCAKTKHQLEGILAKNKLATVALYLNDGWVPNNGDYVWYIVNYINCCHEEAVAVQVAVQRDYFVGITVCSNKIVFKTKELAQQAVEILGEDTVRLALEPLGI